MNEIVTLRDAEQRDCRDLYLWRNDDETRRNSRTTDIVPWNDHCRWLAEVLADPARFLFIGHNGDAKIGTVRLDRVGEGHFIVSITLDPKFRGTGRAKSLLKLAIKRTDARIIEALIREENEKSRRLFASCGFNKVGQVDDHGFSLYRKSGRADD